MNKYKGGSKAGRMPSPYKAASLSPSHDKRRKSGATDARRSSGAVDENGAVDIVEDVLSPEELDTSAMSLHSSFSFHEQDVPFKFWVELSMMEIYNEQVNTHISCNQ